LSLSSFSDVILLSQQSLCSYFVIFEIANDVVVLGSSMTQVHIKARNFGIFLLQNAFFAFHALLQLGETAN
jgi:hypothetical protein